MNKYTVAAVALTTGFLAGNIASEKDVFSILKQDKMTIESSIPTGATTTTLGGIATESTQAQNATKFDSLGVDCSEKTITIVVDERARIGANLSLLKAIDINIPGAISRQLPPEAVYPFVENIAKASGHTELDSHAELDNIPAGSYTTPTGCTNQVIGTFIPQS